jgi:hypothetical protein
VVRLDIPLSQAFGYADAIAHFSRVCRATLHPPHGSRFTGRCRLWANPSFERTCAKSRAVRSIQTLDLLTQGGILMLSVVRTSIFLALISLLAGCAGKDFVRPASETVKLGQTTYAQVIQQMGEPRKTGEVLKNEKNVKSATYVYASTGGEPLEEGVIPARALAYYFHNDILVGQEFLSSFKSDNSNFDESKLPELSKGKTTRAEVVQLLGRPTATFIYPMVKQTSGEAFGYTYNTTRGGPFSGFKIFTKVLRISFDEKGTISDVDYTASGNK